MVKINRLILVVFCLALVACYDKSVGPKFQNGYANEIMVEIKFKDGEVSTAIWPPCRTVYVGHPEKEIEEIVIKFGEDVVHDLNDMEIKKLLNGVSPAVELWSVDSEGIWPNASINCK